MHLTTSTTPISLITPNNTDNIGCYCCMTGYDPEEYQEVVERHNRIDNERRKQKQELKETKRVEDEAIAKKKAEKDKICMDTKGGSPSISICIMLVIGTSKHKLSFMRRN